MTRREGAQPLVTADTPDFSVALPPIRTTNFWKYSQRPRHPCMYDRMHALLAVPIRLDRSCCQAAICGSLIHVVLPGSSRGSVVPITPDTP
jgi:hypothetical protein